MICNGNRIGLLAMRKKWSIDIALSSLPPDHNHAS